MRPSPEASGARETRNAYSQRWFNTFLETIDAETVAREVAFIERLLPRDHFRRVLDLCCGPGRHAVPLGMRAYEVTGIDRNGVVLDMARERALHAAASSAFVRADMRSLPVRSHSFDAVICLWQSFGHFGEAADRATLAEMCRAIRAGGRVVLDIYNRPFHENHLGRRVVERAGIRVIEERTLANRRLRVRLTYLPSNSRAEEDEFEWTLYDAEEIAALARSAGLALMRACTGFDDVHPVTAADVRMQLVFERE